MSNEGILIIEYVLIMLSFLLLIAAVSMIIVYYGKAHLLKAQLKHEMEMKRLEFIQKKDWEAIISAKMEIKKDEDWIKEKDELKAKVKELWEKKNDITPLDMNRIALLHLILSGNKEGITAENLDKEIEKVKKSYEIIEKYLKN